MLGIADDRSWVGEWVRCLGMAMGMLHEFPLPDVYDDWMSLSVEQVKGEGSVEVQVGAFPPVMVVYESPAHEILVLAKQMHEKIRDMNRRTYRFEKMCFDTARFGVQDAREGV